MIVSLATMNAGPDTSFDDLCEFRVDGIGIDYAQREHYLELLAMVVQNQFADHDDWQRVVDELAEHIGYRPEPLTRTAMAGVDFERLPGVMGWFHFERLEQLVQRDWLVGESNEFELHRPLLGRLPSLREARKISILGAGVGAFVDYCAALEQVEAIDVSDLSYLCLHTAKTLLAGEADRLPLRLSGTCTRLHVEDDVRLVQSTLAPKYRCARAPGSAAQLSFRVADACDMRIPESVDLVCLPYLLDAPEHWSTMLARVCDAVHVGQRLSLTTQICPRRDPLSIESFLRQLDFDIEFLALEPLAYSLVRHDQYYARTTVDTLVIEARKTKPLDVAQLGMVAHIDGDTLHSYTQMPIMPGQKFKAMNWSKRERAAVKRALHASNFGEFSQLLSSGLGSSAAAAVLAFVCSRGMISLTPHASGRRFG